MTRGNIDEINLATKMSIAVTYNDADDVINYAEDLNNSKLFKKKPYLCNAAKIFFLHFFAPDPDNVKLVPAAFRAVSEKINVGEIKKICDTLLSAKVKADILNIFAGLYEKYDTSPFKTSNCIFLYNASKTACPNTEARRFLERGVYSDDKNPRFYQGEFALIKGNYLESLIFHKQSIEQGEKSSLVPYVRSLIVSYDKLKDEEKIEHKQAAKKALKYAKELGISFPKDLEQHLESCNIWKERWNYHYFRGEQFRKHKDEFERKSKLPQIAEDTTSEFHPSLDSILPNTTTLLESTTNFPMATAGTGLVARRLVHTNISLPGTVPENTEAQTVNDSPERRSSKRWADDEFPSVAAILEVPSENMQNLDNGRRKSCCSIL